MEFKIEVNSEFTRLQKSINSLHGCEAKIGWFEDDVYDNNYQTPVATVAIIQEKGAVIPARHAHKLGHDTKQKKGAIIIPARPFIEPALKKNASNFSDKIELWSKQVLNGSSTVIKVFEKLAQATRSAIQNEIKSVTSPPLSPATVQNRLSKRKNKKKTQTLYKPLIDTGKMFQSISTQVKET